MSKSNVFENDLLKLIFNAVEIQGIAQDQTLGASTHIYVSLHTADPGEAGNQATSEADYTGYARVAVLRTSAGWTVTDNSVTNAAAITFPQCTGGSNTITHFAVGLASTSAGKVFYKGALTASLAVSNLIIPEFAPGTLTISED